MNYDLEKRTKQFSIDILTFLKEIRPSFLNRSIIEQLARSAASVGANYCEATGASSKKDFRNKIHICKKEAQETRYWIDILQSTENNFDDKLKALRQESQELVLIFNKIAHSSRGSN